MRIIAVTHAARNYGIGDPGHTTKGFARLTEIRASLRNFLGIGASCCIARGTGKRFLEIADSLNISLELFTPFLGGADSNLKDSKDRVLASGLLVPGANYLSLTRAKCFQPWELIAELGELAREKDCEHLVLLTGGEFMGALLRSIKVKDIKSEEGNIYEIFPFPRSVKKRAL